MPDSNMYNSNRGSNALNYGLSGVPEKTEQLRLTVDNRINSAISVTYRGMTERTE